MNKILHLLYLRDIFMKRDNFIDNTLMRRLLFSSIVIGIALVLFNVTTSIIAGRMVSPQAIAAMNLCHPLIETSTLIAAVLSVGAILHAAHCIGKNNHTLASEYFSSSFVSILCFELLFTLVLILFKGPIVEFLCAEDSSLQADVEAYFSILLFSFIPSAVMTMLSNFIIMDGCPGKVVYITLASIAISLIFTYFLSSAWGIKAIAAGYILCYSLCSAALLFHFFTHKSSFGFKRMRKKLLSYLVNNIKSGSHDILDHFCLMVLYFSINVMIQHACGTESSIVWGVVSSLIVTSAVISNSVTNTLLVMGPINRGEYDITGLKKLLKNSWFIKVASLSAIFLVTELFPSYVMDLFGADALVNRDSILEMRIGVFLIFIPSLFLKMSSYFFVLEDHKNLYLSCIILNLLPVLCFGLFYKLAPQYIWYAFPTALLADMLVYLYYGMKLNHSLRSFDQAYSYFETSIPYNYAKMGKELEEIKEFLKEENATEEVMNSLEHCIEELSYNIIKHRPKGIKDKSYNVRIVRVSDGVEVIFKDAGRPFNPVLEFEDTAAEAQEQNKKLMLALRMFNYYASKPSYKYFAGVNITRMHYTF